MARRPGRRAVVDALLDGRVRTLSETLGIDVARGTPSPLFRLLCASILVSARISSDLAVQAARALARRGWTTARKMADSTWEERVTALNRAGYARYDESTARMLGDTAGLLVKRYRGDLRRLREEAGREPRRERELLTEAKGLGNVGVDIFFREAQAAWEELVPFADRRVRAAARRLGLPEDPAALRRLAGARRFPRLVGVLAEVERTGAHEDVLARASR